MFFYFTNLISTLFARESFILANNIAKSEAISALRNAIRLTEYHIRHTRIGEFGEEGFSDFESKELANAWANVAKTIRPFDKSLAESFEVKSDYWINPHGFQREIAEGKRIFDGSIRLSEVKKRIR